MITKKQLIKLLEDDGEYESKNYLFYTYRGNNYDPKILLVIEKMSAYQKIINELKNDKIALICTKGFPNQSIIEGIKQAIKKGIKTYYIGDLDPVSLSIYYTIRHNDLEFKNSKEKNNITYLGIKTSDLTNVPDNYKIKMTDEQRILDYLTNNNLLPELKKEIEFLKKGYKIELEGFNIINNLNDYVKKRLKEVENVSKKQGKRKV